VSDGAVREDHQVVEVSITVVVGSLQYALMALSGSVPSHDRRVWEIGKATGGIRAGQTVTWKMTSKDTREFQDGHYYITLAAKTLPRTSAIVFAKRWFLCHFNFSGHSTQSVSNFSCVPPVLAGCLVDVHVAALRQVAPLKKRCLNVLLGL
jgi:hypothetical protein